MYTNNRGLSDPNAYMATNREKGRAPIPEDRPWEYWPWAARFLEVLAETANAKYACEEAGISQAYLYRQLRKEETLRGAPAQPRHAAFRAEYERVREEAIARLIAEREQNRHTPWVVYDENGNPIGTIRLADPPTELRLRRAAGGQRLRVTTRDD